MIRLGNITTTKFAPLYLKTRIQLRRHKPDFIKQARNAIARKMGYAGMRELEEDYHAILPLTMARDDATTRRSAREVVTAINPDNLKRITYEYTAIHATLKLLRKNLRGIRALQLACNYGPYLHFLKTMAGVEVSGVDIAAAAVEYAQENGLDVREAPASNLPFPKNEFDVVFSKNFLCGSYLGRFTPDPLHDIVAPTLREVHRLLKPGGVFISDKEDISRTDDHSRHSLGQPQTYSAEVIATFSQLEELVVFTKQE